MKKFTAFLLAAVTMLALVGSLPAAATTDNGLLCSGYYGINRAESTIGQIVPGTDEATFLSKVLAGGEIALSNGVKTGSELTLSREGAVIDQLSLVVQADCSGDGNFSITDMLMVKSMLLGQQTFSAAQNQAADVNGDGSVSITDFLQMKRRILGMSDFIPKYVTGAAHVNSLILTIGDTYVFGPAAETTPEMPPETTPEAAPASEESSLPEAVSLEGEAVTWEAGIVTAVKLGTSRLCWGDKTLIVTVCEEALQIALPDIHLYIGPGSTTLLQPSMNHPADFSQITYSVSDSAVAEVTPSGVLTALAQGSTTVTATLPNGASASQEITVIELLESVTVEDDYIKLKPGDQKSILAATAPETSPEKLIWTSSDPSIATVDENGVVTGVAYGTVTVTCASQYGNIAATCKVKVCDLIQVALTYDDGPSSTYTPLVLDMLQEHGIKVTFFMVGNRIRTSPESVKRMADEGHELGYHTWSHTYFFDMTAKEIAADFAQFQAKVKEVSGKEATVYRAPGGNITGTALQTIPLPHIMWSEDTRDWATRNTEAVKQAVLKGLKDGAIILVHDIHATTYYGTKEAIEYIIKNDLDVEFLTVTELLSRKGTAPEAGKTYYKN